MIIRCSRPGSQNPGMILGVQGFRLFRMLGFGHAQTVRFSTICGWSTILFEKTFVCTVYSTTRHKRKSNAAPSKGPELWRLLANCLWKLDQFDQFSEIVGNVCRHWPKQERRWSRPVPSYTAASAVSSRPVLHSGGGGLVPSRPVPILQCVPIL